MIDEIAAETFNTFFTNVGPNINKLFSEQTYINNYTRSSSTIFFTPSTPLEVRNIISSLKKSSSNDNIDSRLLKMVSFEISLYLSHLINLCFQTSVFPDILKIATVIPLYKGGDSTIISDYRPISLLSNISKIIEKAIYSRVYDFIESHHLLSDQQFGFRRSHSTEHALLYVDEIIKDSLEKGSYCVGIFLDISKAFDCVNHSILIKKLENFGIRGPPLKLIQNYLSHRKQQVKVGNSHSSLNTITCGVPQGSILGPLLFVIFINDLISSSGESTICFADDTNIFIVDENIEHLQRKIHNCM